MKYFLPVSAVFLLSGLCSRAEPFFCQRRDFGAVPARRILFPRKKNDDREREREREKEERRRRRRPMRRRRQWPPPGRPHRNETKAARSTRPRWPLSVDFYLLNVSFFVLSLKKRRKRRASAALPSFDFRPDSLQGRGGGVFYCIIFIFYFEQKKKTKKLVPFRVGRRISAGVRRGATGGERPTETEAKRVSRDAGHGFTEFYRVLLAPERLCRLVPSFTGF